MNKTFVKVKAYDRIINDWIVSFINPEKIIQLSSLIDDGCVINIVKFDDMAIRVSNESYAKLVKMLYGKEPENV